MREYKPREKKPTPNKALEQAKAAAEAVAQTVEQVKGEIARELPPRVVKLRYRSCCSCGCYDYQVFRTVPGDSPLKEGDRIERMNARDRLGSAWDY